MKSVLNSLRGRIPFLRPHVGNTNITSVGISEIRPPLYQRIPPWWAQWTYALVACDIVATGSAIDLTWSHWSRPKKGSSQTSPPISDHYELRPVWQRLGLAITHLGIGVGVAVALIVTRSRFIRTFAVLPPQTASPTSTVKGTDNRRVFIQCAHNWKRNGTVFPISSCSIELGRDDTEIILRVKEERGHWYLPLDEALVRGEPSTVPQVRAAILEEWREAKRLGRWKNDTSRLDGRWKSGPVVNYGR